MSARETDYVVVGLGALGSATCYELARRGHAVVGLEQYELGHSRGASHDTSRILRHSYHTPEYVRLTQDAYADWADLERVSGEPLVTVVGGLDLFPPDAAIEHGEYAAAMSAAGVGFEVLDPAGIRERWPQFSVPAGTLALHQADAAIVPAGRGTRVLQEQARRAGAELRDRAAVTSLTDRGGRVEVVTEGGTLSARRVVVCADAWTNQVLSGIGVDLPLEVTLEQVTYLRPERPDHYAPGSFPLWIWMDDPSFYGFPCYGEDTVKVAQDCGGPVVDPDHRTSEVDPVLEQRVVDHMRRMLPGEWEPLRSLRCQYTLTPDRDFVLGPVPGHEAVVVGLGAAHGFKFAPTFGRLLADLAVGATPPVDLAPFRLDRPALVDPAFPARWLV